MTTCPDCPYTICQGASCLEVDIALTEALKALENVAGVSITSRTGTSNPTKPLEESQ